MPGSHIGLLHNPAALYVIADRLAQPPGTHEPFGRRPWLRPFARTGPWRRPAAAREAPTVRDEDGCGRWTPRSWRWSARPSRATSAACRSSGPATGGPLTYDVVRDLLEPSACR